VTRTRRIIVLNVDVNHLAPKIFATATRAGIGLVEEGSA
jgi:hypothetical protein